MEIFDKYFVYNTLKKYKSDKIIIVTTDSEKEANIIGDRVAVIQNGELLCCGSFDYIKKILD